MGFNWLRIGISGGLRSIDSECGSVVDFVELDENMDQWWDLIGSEEGCGLRSTDSKCGSVAEFINIIMKVRIS